ncbi:M3 family oligoendopeptidase, partial [Clostridiaceae bacterium HSG29]|nr:M3 family oligoendopeptidase [Clostridiaceae bacterium HSG29]
NNVPESVYDQLIEAVHNNLPSMHKYISLRKKMLGVEKLRPFDLYVPLIKDVDMKYEYKEAKETVLDSLNILGSDYTDVVKSAFTDGWIDVYENEGKRSGAYSWGTYYSKPYILLNYHNELNDVFTLIHEMGHSMHSHYTRKNQPYVYGDYSIFVAEVASITNEALLNKNLLKKVEEKNKKLYLLNNYLENFRGTVFRQTMFAEFERDIHKYASEGGALTAEQLCKMYRELNIKYYGPDLDIDFELDLEWARIPHFYYNFYVFQYATGFSSAVALADKMTDEGQSAVDAYKEFLKAGSSNYPIDILKRAGVDMTTSEPVNNALDVFKALVDEMESLI